MLFSTLVALLTFFHPAFASDHIDGVATIADGQADLSDLYAFPTPNKVNNMTVILNMYPGVRPSGHFSSKVNYEIGLRLLEKRTPPQNIGFYNYQMDALNLRCRFTDPAHHHGAESGQQVFCELFKEQTVVASINGPVNETIENGSIQLFTGPRADAFFISLENFDGVTKREGFTPQPTGGASNLMSELNALTITVELDLQALGLEHTLWGVSGQSLDEHGNYLDRVGRPEITNYGLHDFSGENPMKRSYNQKPHFAVAEAFNSVYQGRLLDNISAYDLLDGETHWERSDLENLTRILTDDFLVVDLAGVCNGTNQFFEVEKALLLGQETNSCGGRRLTDDIMATLTAYYLGGLYAQLDQYLSGVIAPYQDSDRSLASSFPYLAPPSDTPELKLKLLWLQRQLGE